MAKEGTFYFSHDYNARSDAKIKKLVYEFKMLGYGVYWALIEDLYTNNNLLPLDFKIISKELRTSESIVRKIILDFDLFRVENNFFSSDSVQKRLDLKNQKSIKAKESVDKRWQKDTNVLRDESSSNTLKESKVKESKVNNIEERKLQFASTLESFKDFYGQKLIDDFFRYWSEPNKSNTKFRMELEKTWDLRGRLKTWASRDRSFHAPEKPTLQKIDTNNIDYSKR
jgi:hypothetical protein